MTAMPGDPLVNTDELDYALLRGSNARVLKIQTKLHRWARDDPHRRFDDLFVRHEALVRREALRIEGGARPSRWAVVAGGVKLGAV